MRTNLPVTHREYPFPAGTTLMSTTDEQSFVTYANAAFLAVSGFEQAEIIGQPHNIVRHPDMPPEAFADMWATLKAGKSWTALVKNRRKDGDHYWVRANATPIVRGDKLSGYMSVRTQPSRSEIERAEALHLAFREGRATGLAFHQGLIVRSGWLRPLSIFQVMPLRWRIRLATGSAALLGCAGAAALGIGGGALMAHAAALMFGMTAMSAWLEWQIAKPLALVEQQALSVAAGQPAETVHLDRVDEIGMILRAVNQSGLNLRALVDDVSSQAGHLSATSTEIAQGNNDLSRRTEQAASSLQSTASSMEQMTSTVQQNADTARQASRLAVNASEAAAKGGHAVGLVVDTMQAITTSSNRIADIIAVIDGIAFQTNILALNAAVEAASAGEQGRGFAVVASEVRSLAQRSATAAKEIKSLINESVTSVEAGAKLVDDAGRAMEEIVTQVQHVSDLINEISHATSEQSSGIGQVNHAVSSLDQVTQQNAALVEESAATADSLKGQARRLVEAVAAYGEH
jgi:aerotaxis receptor